MKAFVQNGFGGTETLVLRDIPTPTISNDEVLIEVKAISLNPVDVKTRAGKGVSGRLKEHSEIILGWDVSGVVREVGQNVSTFKVGDEVFGMVRFPGHGKAYAEYVAAPASHLAVKPNNISHPEAAAATLAALTAWQGMTKHGTVKKGDTVLVHAASGGVGHFGVQIAKHLGAKVIGTSSAHNRDFVLSLGTDEHIDYRSQRFEDIATNVQFVLDTVAGETAERSLDTLSVGGTYISILGASPAVLEKAQAKGIRAAAMLVESSSEDMQRIADLLQSGAIKAHVSKTFSFQDMAQAHEAVESGRTVGKVVVTL